MMKKTVKALSIAAIASAASVGAMANAQAADDGAYKVAAHHEKCGACDGCDADKGYCGGDKGCNPCAAEGCNPCAACNPCGGDDNPCNPCGGA